MSSESNLVWRHRFVRGGLAVIVLVLFSTACGSSSTAEDAASDTAPTPEITVGTEIATEPTPTVVKVEPEPDTQRPVIADVNLAIADVPLGDIVFDTFDGGSVTLADATEAQIVGLLNAIPPIDEPNYSPGSTAAWLTPDDIVLGYVADDGTAWAHPHRVLNFHEIVNTILGGRPVVVTYCPLCGSGVVFDRRTNDLRHEGILTFDNTSALYNNDMVMVDPQTHTYWWQVAGRGLVGNLTGSRLTALASTTTSWATWLELHPDTQVLSNDQGLGPSYAFDPFADYGLAIDAGRIPFPVGPEAFADERLSPSTRVIGFEIGGQPAAVAVLANEPTVVEIGSEGTLVVFLDGRGGGAVFDRSTANFSATADGFIDDTTGSTWTSGGLAVDGPAVGQQLEQLPSTTAYWFAWVSTTDGVSTRLFGPDGEFGSLS